MICSVMAFSTSFSSMTRGNAKAGATSKSSKSGANSLDREVLVVLVRSFWTLRSLRTLRLSSWIWSGFCKAGGRSGLEGAPVRDELFDRVAAELLDERIGQDDGD